MTAASIAVKPQRPPRAREDTTAWLGMVIFLASWAVMFGALFFGYGFVRLRAAEWPPSDLPRLPLALPAVNTAVIALSGAVLQFGLSGLRRGRELTLAPAIGLSAILGAAFLALQIVGWRHVYAGGLRPETGLYASVFYGLTWVHAAHVAVGILALAWLCFRAFRGAFSTARHLAVRLWTMYWHFVGIVWAIVFVLVYLV